MESSGGIHKTSDDLTISDGFGTSSSEGGGDVGGNPSIKGGIGILGGLDHSSEIVLGTVETVWPDEHPDDHGNVVHHTQDCE